MYHRPGEKLEQGLEGMPSETLQGQGQPLSSPWGKEHSLVIRGREHEMEDSEGFQGALGKY